MKKKNPVSKEYFRNQQWIVKHYSELCKEYRGKWIAVAKGGKKLCAGNDPDAVRKAIAKKLGISTYDVAIHFMEDSNLIL
jgi:hypothetical protein